MYNDDLILREFSLSALTKVDYLNIRQAAEEDRKLTVSDYFRMLSQFLDLAPAVLDAIRKFAENDADIRAWKSIEAMITLLRELHSDEYVPDLYAVSNAHGKGDHRLAAFHAAKLDQVFERFYYRVRSAVAVTAEGGSLNPDAALYACLAAMDEEETNRKPLVLTVDDSPAILEAVAAVLSSEYRVFKLPKPGMLEEVLKKVTPALFLLDYHMPELSGFELIPIIRNLQEHRDTPIIFLTSEGTIDNVTAAIALGACDFIVKPFLPEQLREKIARHLSN